MPLLEQELLAKSFHSKDRVEGLTHKFYRYPARSSPDFVRQVILEFSDGDDVILDPFMGGGTTVVEALATGRRAVGLDINGLAHFVTKVKTTPLSPRDVKELEEWADSLYVDESASLSLSAEDGGEKGKDSRTRNLPEEHCRFLTSVLESTKKVKFPRQRRFVRCALLRVGQWAMDGNRELPTTTDLLIKLRQEIHEMLGGLLEFVEAARAAGIAKNKITGSRILVQGSVADPAIRETLLAYGQRPKLLVTSPPYPGVHILYHRWQVLGRRETPAPYWLADLRDGHGASFYTMGSRSSLGLRNYFSTLQRGFENLRSVLSPITTVVQLVAFCDTEAQLPLYREALAAAGYEELGLPRILTNGNPIRTVPNRKWYTYKQESNDASREVLMVHRIRGW